MSYRRHDYIDINRRPYEAESRSYSTRHVDTKDDPKFYRNYEFSRTESDIDRYTKAPQDTSLRAEVLSLEGKVALKESKLAEVESELKRASDYISHQEKVILQLKADCEEFDTKSKHNSSNYSKSELTVNALNADNRKLQERMLELEERLRKHYDELGQTSHTALQWEKNYEDLRHALSRFLFPENFADKRSHETLLRKLDDFVSEHHAMRGHSMKVEDNLNAAEDELKNNRETVKRFRDEIEQMKRYISSTDLMREERDAAVRAKEQAYEEMKKMENRLAQQFDSADQARNELLSQNMKLSQLDADVRKQAQSSIAYNQEMKAFKETLSLLLSDGYKTISPSEDHIKDHIRYLQANQVNVGEVTDRLEHKIKQLACQLEEQAELHKAAVHRARKAEEDLDEVKQRYKGLSGELTATDIIKDSLKSDKQKYVSFLNTMAEVMRLNDIVKDLGVEMNGDALIARAEQLVAFESDTLNNKSGQLLGTQKQLKDAKKQIDNKDLHLDLLRKKLANLETDLKDEAERNWDEVEKKNKHLSRKLEKVERENFEAKKAFTSVKSEYIESKSLKAMIEDHRKTIAALHDKIRDLEEIKSKQSKKIASLKDNIHSSEYETQHGLKVTESTLQSLSNELQRTKQRLEETQKREKQLLDLRHVMARMMGLDCEALAVPDYEIISRLEKLIESQHEMALASRQLNFKSNANQFSSKNFDDDVMISKRTGPPRSRTASRGKRY